ncbi:DUF938 domain-containing protein [Telmatospirillum sp. J64-1]|uniref:DUF938 domain-containing protein n=1 Tax=Telmatospirillum sp. J64-1 TaxID=2502183 RepID=UPI00163D6B03|nr:DUF938 domain-containing protein [Telmatospirillum sp. J64-1]
MTDLKRHAPATSRNREPILEVLRKILPRKGLVLEIASGTGEHAAFFAPALPDITWQPTDIEAANIASIKAWAAEAGAPNLLDPESLDVRAEMWPVSRADAIFCANMIHIAPWEACVALLKGASKVLPPDGLLILYGPFRQGGRHTAESNERFDESLRSQDPAWGVRDLEEVAREAAAHGLIQADTISMPANNLIVLFRRAQP